MHLAKDIVDFLLKQRVDGEKALILDLKKQSKVCIHLNKVLSGHFSFHFFWLGANVIEMNFCPNMCILTN